MWTLLFGILLSWNTYLIMLLCISYLWQQKCYVTNNLKAWMAYYSKYLFLLMGLQADSWLSWLELGLMRLPMASSCSSRHLHSLTCQRVWLGKLGWFGSMPHVSSTSGLAWNVYMVRAEEQERKQKRANTFSSLC